MVEKSEDLKDITPKYEELFNDITNLINFFNKPIEYESIKKTYVCNKCNFNCINNKIYKIHLKNSYLCGNCQTLETNKLPKPTYNELLKMHDSLYSWKEGDDIDFLGIKEQTHNYAYTYYEDIIGKENREDYDSDLKDKMLQCLGYSYIKKDSEPYFNYIFMFLSYSMLYKFGFEHLLNQIKKFHFDESNIKHSLFHNVCELFLKTDQTTVFTKYSETEIRSILISFYIHLIGYMMYLYGHLYNFYKKDFNQEDVLEKIKLHAIDLVFDNYHIITNICKHHNIIIIPDDISNTSNTTDADE